MTFVEKLQAELTSSMKSRNEKRTNALRFLLSALKAKEKDKQGAGGERNDRQIVTSQSS